MKLRNIFALSKKIDIYCWFSGRFSQRCTCISATESPLSWSKENFT